VNSIVTLTENFVGAIEYLWDFVVQIIVHLGFTIAEMRIYTLSKSTFSLCHVIIGLCLIYMCYLNNFLMVT
jgi:hypothetical protein